MPNYTGNLKSDYELESRRFASKSLKLSACQSTWAFAIGIFAGQKFVNLFCFVNWDWSALMSHHHLSISTSRFPKVRWFYAIRHVPRFYDICAQVFLGNMGIWSCFGFGSLLACFSTIRGHAGKQSCWNSFSVNFRILYLFVWEMWVCNVGKWLLKACCVSVGREGRVWRSEIGKNKFINPGSHIN